jgi:hypothetical protein
LKQERRSREGKHRPDPAAKKCTGIMPSAGFAYKPVNGQVNKIRGKKAAVMPVFLNSRAFKRPVTAALLYIIR